MAWRRAVLRRPNTRLKWTSTENRKYVCRCRNERDGPHPSSIHSGCRAVVCHLQPDVRQAGCHLRPSGWDASGQQSAAWRASGWERPGDGLPVSTCPSSVSRRVGITSTRWVSTWLLVPGATARLNHDSAQAASRTEPPLGAWSNRRGAVEATYDRRGRHDLNQHALLSERFGVLITFFKSSPG